jgi:hypothetical protein
VTAFLSVWLNGKPELKQTASTIKSVLPNLSDFQQRTGFKMYIAQELPYDSLGAVANKQVAGKEFQVGKGFLKKKQFVLIR